MTVTSEQVWAALGDVFDPENGMSIVELGLVYGANENLTGDGGEPQRIGTVRVSSNVFAMLGVQPALGRLFTPEGGTEEWQSELSPEAFDVCRRLKEHQSTRLIPVVIVTALYGERGTGQLLVFSQVILSMQLPFAVIPLVRFVSDRRKMGQFVIPAAVAAVAWVVASVIVILNLKLLVDTLFG